MHNTILLLILISLYTIIRSSHFRGGIITWKHTGTQVEVRYRLSFRRGAFGRHNCNDSTILNGDLVSGEGSLQCMSGCSDNIVDTMDYFCTDYSVDEDWTTGERTVKYVFPATPNNSYYFGYMSCCWITLVEGGGSAAWSVVASANLTVRKDTGKINTSPISAMQPIARFIFGCSYTLKIPVSDLDGDTVRCRWSANSFIDECGGVCSTLSGAVLDESACILTYSATNYTGWYAVALQIEDFASAKDTAPLSSIPLQFMVYVFSSNGSCDAKPEVLKLNLTSNDSSIATIALNATFFQAIIANSGSTSVSITEINTVSPIGMIKSEVLPYGTSGMEWHINVTWTPSPTQTGTHIFCYTAVNSIGQASDQSCINIEVDGDDCINNACENGATCVDGISSHSCFCPSSHTGKRCQTDIDFCDGISCQNGGTCNDGLYTYSCQCPVSHTGPECETDIDFCIGVTCENKGSCEDGEFDYTCVCAISHTGKNCETDIDFCIGVTCYNGGTCVDGLFDYYCRCPLTHFGDHCESESDDPGYIVSLVFVSIALLTCGGIMTVVFVRHVKRKLPKMRNNASSAVHAQTWPNSDIPFVNMDTGHTYS